MAHPTKTIPPFGTAEVYAFAVLLGAHLFAAFFTPIQDCDETFNFWEPSHYLNHKYGLQTWELSPVYAIRSWLYASIHSLAIEALGQIKLGLPRKTVEFFGLRCALALTCALCETRLFMAVYRTINPRIAIMFVAITATSAGMFIASASYLPSTFVMYTTTVALANFIDNPDGNKTTSAIARLALGTIVGWPFIAVLSFPLVVYELSTGIMNQNLTNSFKNLTRCLSYSMQMLLLESAIDSLFYGRLISVPFNIVKYNVLSKSGKGPDIYGTEPWHFYIRNLLINFNLWFPLALLNLPLLLALSLPLLRAKKGSTALGASKQTLFRNIILISPLYIWLLIFTLQPHKEERFMYPIYPSITLNAAMSLHLILVNFGSTSFNTISSHLKLLCVTLFTCAALTLGIWRSAGLATAYSAPLSIYRTLHTYPLVNSNPLTPFNVCVGKEWYRFPSSYHLPSNTRLKFIRSDFAGLLPGEFLETSTHPRKPFPAARAIPPRMNDHNMQDPGKFVSLRRCDFLVDSYFPDRENGGASELEPNYIKDTDNWDPVKCIKFLDTASSHVLARLFWIPDSRLVPHKFRRRWGEYCLLRARHKNTT